MICENCEKEHDGSYGSGRFCSKSCKMSYCGKKNTKHPSGLELKNRKGFGGKPKDGGWICPKCNLIFRTRKELRKHNINTNHKNNQNWAKGLTAETSSIIANHAIKMKQNFLSGKTKNHMTGKHHSEESKRKIRYGVVNYLTNIVGSRPRYNKKSIPILEKIAKDNNLNIRHAENGGEFYTGIGYFVDGYDELHNIVIEYDEPKHYIDIENNILKEKDIKRQNEIIEHLHCEIWRYNERTKKLWKVVPTPGWLRS